ncbi:hypothetical protein Gogos_002007 [Gossypium gossypioides]|uniref:DUF4283 domain-containing protein n=1 Tax=Gossypium gossypioides TaxID=34282 RepID=A0A7J9CQC0_GOSGO|nr:hypothetical protein [Gossypium gossypioides]
MANLNTVDVDLANLNIMDEEEDPLVVVGDDITIDPEYGLCLVGRVFTDSIVNFPSLKNTLANLWHPLRRVSITEIEDKRILFRFYSEIDLKRVMDNLSLMVTPKRGGQLVSKWLREELENDRRYELSGAFCVTYKKPMDLRIEDSMGQIEEIGDGSELEDMPVEFVDGKKRQDWKMHYQRLLTSRPTGHN